MRLYIFYGNPDLPIAPVEFPFTVGRDSGCSVSIQNPGVSSLQFRLEKKHGKCFLINESLSNPTLLDGEEIIGSTPFQPDREHLLVCGETYLVIGPEKKVATLDYRSKTIRWVISTDGVIHGPVFELALQRLLEEGSLRKDSLIWQEGREADARPATSLLVFPEVDPVPSAPPPDHEMEEVVGNDFIGRQPTSEELEPQVGVSFRCPYCRTVSYLEDVLAISVSPSMLGDDILGQGAQRRFLPSRFTANGLPIDTDGGVCTESACPRCHMSLPTTLLDIPQIVMSVIGAAGAGKSVFLASSIWQCRHILGKEFDIQFMDMDPVANRWINDYEERLFFQEDPFLLQQIAKTDLNSSVVTKSILLDGDSVLLPLPSFFQVKPRSGPASCLVIYDSAGEHFRAGADDRSSLVTLNMLYADLLFFMYDPTADPRFAPYLEKGRGDAKNYAQRQDTLLAEMAARIRRHMGNRGTERLTQPLLFGISKADLLGSRLHLGRTFIRKLPDGRNALDLDALDSISEEAERLMEEVAPEVAFLVHDIAEKVWFLPISSLGHNPMKEGIRSIDVHPIWAELPVLITLARRGIVPTVGGKGLSLDD